MTRLERLATVAGFAAGCGGTGVAPPKSDPVDVPAAKAVERSAPLPSATGRSPQGPDHACFAEPWIAVDRSIAPRQLSPGAEARLKTLLAPAPDGCRDTNPELPAGTSSTPMPIHECHDAIARIYLESRRWVEAAHWFRRVAFEHPDTDDAIFAGQFYLHSLNVLASQGSTTRRECYELMAEEADSIACTRCRNREDDHPCRVLRDIRFEVRWTLDKGAPPVPNPALRCKDGQQAAGDSCQQLPPLLPATCGS